MTAVAPVGAKLPSTITDLVLARNTFAQAFDRAPDFAGRVLESLYAAQPQLKGTFTLTVEGQEALLEEAIQIVLASLENRVVLDAQLAVFGKVLADHGVSTRSYGWLGLTILETLNAILVDVCTPRRRRAVARVWRQIAISLRG